MTTSERIACAESVLRAAGFPDARVADRDGVARIVVADDDVARLVATGLRDSIAADVRACGFRHVAVGLDGA